MKKPVIIIVSILIIFLVAYFGIYFYKQYKISKITYQPEEVINENDVTLKTSEKYEILAFDYDSKKSFVIIIMGDNFEEIRMEAEQALIQSLGVNKSLACDLDVSVVVSKEISDSLAGINYGLSFCKNSQPIVAQ